MRILINMTLLKFITHIGLSLASLLQHLSINVRYCPCHMAQQKSGRRHQQRQDISVEWNVQSLPLPKNKCVTGYVNRDTEQCKSMAQRPFKQSSSHPNVRLSAESPRKRQKFSERIHKQIQIFQKLSLCKFYLQIAQKSFFVYTWDLHPAELVCNYCVFHCTEQGAPCARCGLSPLTT